MLVFWFTQWVEQDALNCPEQVCRGEDNGCRRDDGEYRHRLERSNQHEKLADEPVRAGQADAAERYEGEHRREHRYDARDAPIRRDLARVPTLVDHADEKKQGTCRNSMIDHDHQRPLHTLHGQREDTEHDEPEVTHRRVGHELLEVRLHHRHERAIHDSDDGQPKDERAHGLVERRRGE